LKGKGLFCREGSRLKKFNVDQKIRIPPKLHQSLFLAIPIPGSGAKAWQILSLHLLPMQQLPHQLLLQLP